MSARQPDNRSGKPPLPGGSFRSADEQQSVLASLGSDQLTSGFGGSLGSLAPYLIGIIIIPDSLAPPWPQTHHALQPNPVLIPILSDIRCDQHLGLGTEQCGVDEIGCPGNIGYDHFYIHGMDGLSG